MSSNKELRKSKHAAYEKKQAEKGERIIKWIFFRADSIGHLLCHLFGNHRVTDHILIKLK